MNDGKQESESVLLETHANGILLPVRAQPGSRKDEIRGVQNGCLKVAVTQVAEKGKANKAITKFLAKSLGLKNSQVELLRGDTSTDKHFLITGIAEADLRERLAASHGGG